MSKLFCLSPGLRVLERQMQEPRDTDRKNMALNVFYGIDALHSRIESRDKYLFDAGMISEQAMAHTLYIIKELTDKLDAYGVEPS